MRFRGGINAGGQVAVNKLDIFDRVLVSLHDATLDDAHWPAASALIDEACGATGNSLVVGDGFGDDVRVHFAAFHRRGERREEIQRTYFEDYHLRDERLPRLRQLPDGKLVRIPSLYTARELKTSPAYNEALQGYQNGLNVRLDGPRGSRIVLAFADPIGRQGWQSAHTRMIKRLLPHVRQFARMRQELAAAEALGDSLRGLLDNPRIGVIHLDRRGRIVETNDRALDILRRHDGLTAGADGVLRTWLPGDETRFRRLLARVVPTDGRRGESGSMAVRRHAALPSLALHAAPVGRSQEAFGPGVVAALLLLVDPASRLQLDPRLVADTLGLTASECEVAMALAEGRSVRDVAMAGGRLENATRFHLKRIYRRLGIAGQADLVRLVLSLAELPGTRN